jgi:N-acetylneuraminate synthase
MPAYTLIAEVGCNHKGDLKIAKEFIDVATGFCKVRHIKFQKRTVRELLTEEEYVRPHPVPYHSYGRTYGEHREFLEFEIEQHRELKEYCELRGAIYACSVWDLTSLKEIMSLRPAYIKIPSAMNTRTDLLEHACSEFPGPIHISLGMTTLREEGELVDLFHSRGRLRDLVLYACTSGYPIQASEACLLEIRRLHEAYGPEVRGIGYSGHHNGISLDIAAFTLGAAYIERHFTLNRTWKGTDHAASLEPDGLRRLNRDLGKAAEALTYKPCEILPVEEEQRQKLKQKPDRHA